MHNQLKKMKLRRYHVFGGKECGGCYQFIQSISHFIAVFQCEHFFVVIIVRLKIYFWAVWYDVNLMILARLSFSMRFKNVSQSIETCVSACWPRKKKSHCHGTTFGGIFLFRETMRTHNSWLYCFCWLLFIRKITALSTLEMLDRWCGSRPKVPRTASLSQTVFMQITFGFHILFFFFSSLCHRAQFGCLLSHGIFFTWQIQRIMC